MVISIDVLPAHVHFPVILMSLSGNTGSLERSTKVDPRHMISNNVAF